MARRSRGALTSARGLAFPTQWKRTLNYVDKISLDPPTGGLTTSYRFRANSIYDPDQSGTGHQPLGYDEIILGYERWTVIGSKITATFTASQSTSALPLVVGIEVQDSTVATANVGTIIERGRARYKHTSGAQGGPSVVTVTNGFSTKKFFGLSSLKAGKEYQGLATADCPRQAFYSIFAADAGTNDPAPIDVTVKIEYYVIFQEPRRLTQST